MNCKELAELAPFYLSGEITVEMNTHLAECWKCSREMEAQKAMDARLHDLFPGDLPGAAEVQGAVRRTIAREQRLRWAAMAAAILLAAFVGYRAVRPEAPTRLLTDAARDHRIEVMEHQPRRWRTDAGEIEKLASRYQLTDVAALAPPGYKLEHAKMCGLEGQAALHLVYTNGAQEFSVYIRSNNGAGKVIHTVRVGSEQLASFQTRRHEAVVATAGSSSECLQFAKSVVKAL